MVALCHAGGMAAGAFNDGPEKGTSGEDLSGFVFGFPSYQARQFHPTGLHSHLLAVLPEYQGRGLGKALKWFQRDWCLAQGLPWMTWTFDPLQAKNARLNLEHLGAVAKTYRVDEYGTLGGALAGTLPTDRLLAFWDLAGTRPSRLAQGSPPSDSVSVADLEALPLVLSNNGGLPGVPDKTRTEPRLRAEIPDNFTHYLHHNPETALAWRMAARDVLATYLDNGYTVTRFLDRAYLLEKRIKLL